MEEINGSDGILGIDRNYKANGIDWKEEINGSDGLVGIGGSCKANGIDRIETVELTELMKSLNNGMEIMGKWYEPYR